MSGVYPSVEEVFGPGRIVRLDPYDAIRDARSGARYDEDPQAEPHADTWTPLEAPVSPPEGLTPRG